MVTALTFVVGVWLGMAAFGYWLMPDMPGPSHSLWFDWAKLFLRISSIALIPGIVLTIILERASAA